MGGTSIREATVDDAPAIGELHVLAWQAAYRGGLLWVVPGNVRARSFYEAAGSTCEDVTRTDEVLGVEVPEVRYRRPLGN